MYNNTKSFNNMNVNDLKSLVKSYFNLTEASTVKQEFAEATLADGTTKIYWDGDLAVGTKVYLLDAEGNQIPAPEGSHTLEDGKNIVLGTEGEVLEVAEAAREEMIEQIAVDPATGVPIDTPVTFEEEVAAPIAVEDIVKAVVEAVQEEMAKYAEKMSAVEAKVETFSAAPASEKTLPGSVKKASKPAVEPLQKERFERVLNSVKINRN